MVKSTSRHLFLLPRIPPMIIIFTHFRIIWLTLTQSQQQTQQKLVEICFRPSFLTAFGIKFQRTRARACMCHMRWGCSGIPAVLVYAEISPPLMFLFLIYFPHVVYMDAGLAQARLDSPPFALVENVSQGQIKNNYSTRKIFIPTSQGYIFLNLPF